MIFLPKPYVEVLKRRDFFILTLVILVGQIASAFLILSLIVSVYSRTGSNLGVSGVILSFAIPAFFLMAFSGLIADIFDRKRTILLANLIIAFVVFVILLTEKAVFASIPLSFLYFAGNSFFIPASSAATAQLVKRSQLLVANTIFIFVLAGGVLFGFFAASLVHFLFDNMATLIVCELLLILAVVLSLLLPPLPPSGARKVSILKTIKHIGGGFVYIMKAKVIWFFFLTFAVMQGVIIFAVTLAPGFFRDVAGLSIDTSPMFVLPPIAVGVIAGALLINRLKNREGMLVSIGVWTLGLALLALGLMIRLHLVIDGLLVLFLVPFLFLLGFGVMVVMIASRTVMQKGIPHNHQGTVFGANIILASFLAVIMSPLAVLMEDIFGYVNLLILGGVLFLAASLVFAHIGSRWKF